METRIRHFRKLRGWTLQDLAGRIGTTAQTIQRLETANMTVSTDWLERIGAALGLSPISLLAAEGSDEIPLIGSIGNGGLLREGGASGTQSLIGIDVPAERPVAVRIAETIGPYPAGVLLIGNRLEGNEMHNAVGRDSLIRITSGPVVLRRVIRGTGNTFTLVPLDDRGDVRYDQAAEWIARLVMRVDYL